MADKLLKLIIVVLFISFRPVSSVEEPNSEGKLSYRVFMIKIFSGNFSSRRKNAFLLLGCEPRANGLDMCVSVKKIDVNFCSGKKNAKEFFPSSTYFLLKGKCRSRLCPSFCIGQQILDTYDHQFDSARKNCSRDHLFFTRLKW